MAVTERTLPSLPSRGIQCEDRKDPIAPILERKRSQLMREAGLEEEVRHFTRPKEHKFARKERGQVTLLFGGLTVRHDAFIKAAMEGLGYCIKVVPTAVKADFQAGKEYGNNGQCNPTYFTVGALVNYLKDLRDGQGVAVKDLLNNYVFVTAGACGPCRFGMYEAEYRLALRNSGFDGFRVLLFQQQGGLKQAGEEEGLELNTDFALAFFAAVVLGDLLNEFAYQLRPYEVIPGEVDRVFESVNELIKTRLREYDFRQRTGSLKNRVLASCLSTLAPTEACEKILIQVASDYFPATIRECVELIKEIEVDYTRAKPICKVTGEFWAQTTEGDGNYHMFEFLESQGAEVLVEPVITWANYMVAQERMKLRDRRGLEKAATLRGRLKQSIKYGNAQLRFAVAAKIINHEYDRIRRALGGTTHAQVNQLELQRMGHPYYSSRAAGGEGHLEVAKNIYYSNKDLAHMVMSLKPFGCMPSTQSDGAQAAVTAHFPQMIYIPIETSGEGDINAHSRAQMALGEAKIKCKSEFKACLEKTGYTLDEIRRYVAESPQLRSPLLQLPAHKGIVGKAANFVLEVGRRMDGDRALIKTRVATGVVPAKADSSGQNDAPQTKEHDRGL